MNMHSKLSLPWFGIALLLAVTAVACAPAVANDPEPTRSPDNASDLPIEDPGTEPGGGGGAGADPNIGVGKDLPIVVGPTDPGGDPGSLDGGALPVDAEPGIVDARPHAWDHISVAPDGTTVTIYYYGGVQDCYGLAGVDVQRGDDGLLKLTVFEGRRGELPPDTACIEIAVLKAVTITLDEPLVAPVAAQG